MTIHDGREGEYICCGGRDGQEEGSGSKTILTPKQTPVNFLKLSLRNTQLKVMLVTHLKYSQLNSIIWKPYSGIQNMNKMHTEMLSNVLKIREYSSSQQLSSYCHFSLTAFKILSETSWYREIKNSNQARNDRPAG